MSGRLLAAALTAAVAGTLLASPAQAAPVTLTAGHVDVLDVDYAGGALTLDLRDGTGSTPVDRAPAEVTLAVPAAAKTTVPSGSAWSFLGTPGSTVWVLPQSQNPSLLFAGWDTTGATGVSSLTFRLTGVSGPGRFSVYTTGSFGTPAKLFDSGDGLPDSLAVAAGTHAHANWAFGAAGTYAVTFEVTGAGVPGTATATYTFAVSH
ncbi:choice-of-anchor M domain-containing protein [Catenuloplanes atrovinosus]|uniref:Surface-anchored protein n=1 Tax=Catenuloplanes atrovinosus TaxID=137266 RepID=A0AAE4CAY3_9ACTN|nr:choice-of-anchor M domain-containing protein [Catenuloplanes atrovinosus]MDR7277543.1 surface-anchored protein [Catenuloplanes atrovinosus]